MHEIASTRVRYGFWRIFVLIRRDGWHVNHKRIYRLYKEEGLNLRTKRPRRRKENWRQDYNNFRSYSALGDTAPALFARQFFTDPTLPVSPACDCPLRGRRSSSGSELWIMGTGSGADDEIALSAERGPERAR